MNNLCNCGNPIYYIGICRKCYNALRILRRRANLDEELLKEKVYRTAHKDRQARQNSNYRLRHPLREVWHNMKKRCYSNRNISYSYYGGRGITVCKDWLEFPIFESWCLSHGWKSNLTIDRIDNNGNYEPSNCQFIPKRDNCIKRNFSRSSITARGLERDYRGRFKRKVQYDTTISN